MPFDAATYERSEELRILHEMEAFFSVPGNWCQKTLGTKSGQRCLLGCLYEVSTGRNAARSKMEGMEQRLPAAGRRVLGAVAARAPDRYRTLWGAPCRSLTTLWQFNDGASSVDSVTELVRLTRVAMEKEKVHAV